MGSLLSTLQVGRDGMPTAQELGQDRHEVDADSQCPAETPGVVTIDMGPTPATAEAAPARPAAPMPLPAAAPAETIQQALAGWTAAWSSKDFPRYRGYYAKSFTPEGGHSLEHWASARAARLSQPGAITIGVSDLKASTIDANKATTEFRQTYTSANYRDAVIKHLEWVREGNTWKIQREQVPEAREAAGLDVMNPGTK